MKLKSVLQSHSEATQWGGDSVFITGSCSGPGTKPGTTCPIVLDSRETGACEWHHCIFGLHDGKFL